jgi:hypothetical protein
MPKVSLPDPTASLGLELELVGVERGGRGLVGAELIGSGGLYGLKKLRVHFGSSVDLLVSPAYRVD